MVQYHARNQKSILSSLLIATICYTRYKRFSILNCKFRIYFFFYHLVATPFFINLGYCLSLSYEMLYKCHFWSAVKPVDNKRQIKKYSVWNTNLATVVTVICFTKLNYYITKEFWATRKQACNYHFAFRIFAFFFPRPSLTNICRESFTYIPKCFDTVMAFFNVMSPLCGAARDTNLALQSIEHRAARAKPHAISLRRRKKSLHTDREQEHAIIFFCITNTTRNSTRRSSARTTPLTQIEACNFANNQAYIWKKSQPLKFLNKKHRFVAWMGSRRCNLRDSPPAAVITLQRHN